jgi:hypothetical protein
LGYRRPSPRLFAQVRELGAALVPWRTAWAPLTYTWVTIPALAAASVGARGRVTTAGRWDMLRVSAHMSGRTRGCVGSAAKQGTLRGTARVATQSRAGAGAGDEAKGGVVEIVGEEGVEVGARERRQ